MTESTIPRWKVYLVYPYIFFIALTLGLVVPAMPELQIAFFNRTSNCKIFNKSSPLHHNHTLSCNAKAQSVDQLVTAIANLLSLISLPYWGLYSDKYGRQLLFRLAVAGPMVTIGALTITTVKETTYSFYLYYALQCMTYPFLAGLTSITAYVGPYIADFVEKESRIAYFAAAAAMAGLCVSIGTMIAGILVHKKNDLTIGLKLATVISILNFVYVWCFIPESLPVSSRRSVVENGSSIDHELGATTALLKNKDTPKKPNSYSDLFFEVISDRFILCAIIIGFFTRFPEDGLKSTTLFYLQKVADFQPLDNSHYMVLTGVSVLLSMGAVLPILRFCLEWRLKTILFISCIFVDVHFFSFVVFTTKKQFLLSALASGLCIIAQPCLQQLISSRFPKDRQGEALGSIVTATNGLSAVAGPLIMGTLYRFLDVNGSIQYTFVVASVLSLIAVITSIYWIFVSDDETDENDYNN
eukprot:g2781.t1